MIARAVPVVLLLALAPLQCTRKQDPSMKMDDTADDSLWSLAEDFKAKGNREAYLSTLRFLVTRYPGSRRAAPAREELDAAGQGSAGAPASP